MIPRSAQCTQKVIPRSAHNAHRETPREKPASIGWAENAGWADFLGWAPKPASIQFQKMLAEFEIILESSISKHLKMKNAGWMGWAASFRGPASIGCSEMLAGLIFLAGLASQPAFCVNKC